MSMQKEYSSSLFIFNDNEEYHHTARKEAGNTIMIIFNKYFNVVPPKSAGVPIGTLSDGGYQKFTPKVKNN